MNNFYSTPKYRYPVKPHLYRYKGAWACCSDRSKEGVSVIRAELQDAYADFLDEIAKDF